MGELLLIKHAPPEIKPEVISHRRVLSAEGRVLARAKARFVALPRSVVSQLAAGS